MSSYPGVFPLDPASLVGAVRLNLGDIEATPLDPPVAGEGNYKYFSDTQIQAFLNASRNSVARATGSAIKQTAFAAALSEREVKTDDLLLNNKGRGNTLLAVAQSWFAQADAEDAAAVADIFEIAQYPGRSDTVVAGYPV